MGAGKSPESEIVLAAISRIENHSEDIRLSTLSHYAKALGKKLKVVIQ